MDAEDMIFPFFLLVILGLFFGVIISSGASSDRRFTESLKTCHSQGGVSDITRDGLWSNDYGCFKDGKQIGEVTD